VSDCEELVGFTHRRWWGWFFRVFQSIFYKRIYFFSECKFFNRLNQRFYQKSWDCEELVWVFQKRWWVWCWKWGEMLQSSIASN